MADPSTLLVLLALLSQSPSQSWREAVLSPDPAVRGPALARLHAKGKGGLYAVQDLVAKAADPATRALAIRALGELGDPEAEWALRLELKQTSPEVLAALATAIGRLQLTSLLKPLAEKVGDPDPALCAALGALAKSSPGLEAAARAALESPDAARQLAGARILLAAGEALPEAAARKLLASSNAEAKLAGAQALVATDPQAAIDAYGDLLAPGASEAAARAAIEALGALGTPEAAQRLEALFNQPAREPAALAALARSAPGVRALLRRRGWAAIAPAQATAIDQVLEAQAGVPEQLLALLGDSDPAVAHEAALRLAQRPAGVEALARCLQNLTPQAPRCAAGLAGSPLAQAQVQRALASLDPQIRALMVAGLAAAPAPASLEQLAALLNDPSAEVRLALTEPLARLGQAGCPALRTLFRDSDARVRTAAATQLARLLPADGLRALVATAIEDPAVRAPLLAVVDRLPDADAIRLLIAVLHTSEPELRRKVVAQLARYSDPQALNALMDEASKEADPSVRDYAVLMLASQ